MSIGIQQTLGKNKVSIKFVRIKICITINETKYKHAYLVNMNK